MRNQLTPDSPAAPPDALAHPVGKNVRSVRYFTGKRWRRTRETLLAYLFLAPAFAVIGLFGLFPLVFAAYESSLRGINRVLGTYDGLGNYVFAMGELTYVLGFGGALFLGYLAIRMIITDRQEAKEKDRPFWLWALPGITFGAATMLALAWILRLLPLLLAIPDQMRARRGDAQPFDVLAGQALRDPGVMTMLWSLLIALLLGAVITVLVQRSLLNRNVLKNYISTFTAATILIGMGVGVAILTWAELQMRVAEAEVNGGLDIYSQILLISVGFVLLGLSWRVWQSASGQESTRSTVLRLMGGAMLLVGAWLLIGELPRAIGSGDAAWWKGLLATFYYAVGTVPFQLILGLVLAVLLFQPIRGKSFYRMIFFLPYIAPFVGTAAVFKIIFSGRPAGPINSILGFFNIPSLGWLNDPNGVGGMIFSGASLPGWALGPSLALVVIMIFGIWTFFGFNTVVFLAGLGNIPKEMYEVASIDGANRWEQFRHITLPLLSPTIYFLTLYSVIGTFKAFNHIYVMRTGAALGTTDTASVVIFQMFKRDTRYGYASALAILLLLIIILFTVINNRVADERVHYG